MESEGLPLVAIIPDLSTSQNTAILDVLFEPCTELHTLSLPLLRSERFQSYYDLIASVGVQLTSLADSGSTSDKEWLEKILGAHPRLGEKKVDSAQSRAEQAQLRPGEHGEEDELMELNATYERTFPGLKYVVFVNGRSRSVIMNDMQARIKRDDIKLERFEAIKAMCDIAADRALKMKTKG